MTRNFYASSLAAAALLSHAAQAQVGIGTGSVPPRTMLDINGALLVAEARATVSGNAATIPTGYGLVRLSGPATAAVSLTAAAAPAPVAGQQLIIHNPLAFAATFGGQAIGSGRTLAFVYTNGSWQTTGAGDNLGSHTAQQALNLQANALTGTGSSIGAAVGVGITAAGGLNLGQNTAGKNIFVGYQSGHYTTTGTNNQFAGYQSGIYNTTGSNNLFAGYQCGINNATGSNNTAFGYGAGPVSIALTNAAAFGYRAQVSQSNSLVLGGTGPDAVSVGIGTTAPTATLDVVGTTKLRPAGTAAAVLEVAGSWQLGGSGTVVNALLKVSNVPLDKALSVPGGSSSASAKGTLKVPKTVVAGSIVAVSPVAVLPGAVAVAYALVSAAGTVTIVFTNTSRYAQELPTSTTFNVVVVQ